MSWFARSIANSLNLHDEEDDTVNHAVDPSKSTPSSPRGVKEDLSEITQTLLTLVAASSRPSLILPGSEPS
ncbi:hypothetical protein Leryth_002629 [Lithospermum erythrorhizon]|nr:hypothetical protein Leryth_002629 [Lithospermum erythrorhizon]